MSIKCERCSQPASGSIGGKELCRRHMVEHTNTFDRIVNLAEVKAKLTQLEERVKDCEYEIERTQEKIYEVDD